MTDFVADEGSGFDVFDNALRFRQIMASVAREQFEDQVGNVQIGRCVSVNLPRMKADVWIPGDPAPISVNMFPDTVPGEIGDSRITSVYDANSTVGPGSVVAVAPFNGKQYITRVLSGGQFAYELGAASLGYKVFNAQHAIPAANERTAQVSGTYGRVMSFLMSPTVNQVMVGPFCSVPPQQGMNDGIVRINVSRLLQTTQFEFDIHQAQLNRSGTTPSWMRVLPKKSGSGFQSTELALDISWRNTFIRDKLGGELWLRFTELSGGIIDTSLVNVEAFGPILFFGDPNSGRLTVEDSNSTEFDGWLGFHGSNHFYRKRLSEVIATDAPFDSGQDKSWNPGPWRDSGLRLAHDLGSLWGVDGNAYWNGTHIKWDGYLDFLGVGRSYYGLTRGRFRPFMPAAGVKIPLRPQTLSGGIGSVTVTTTADGIPLKLGDTLYISIPPGMGSDGTNGMTNWHTNTDWLFFIVDSLTSSGIGSNYKLPEFAIPLFRRGTAEEGGKIFATSNAVEIIDSTTYRYSVLTAATAAFTAETTVMTLGGSFTFKAGKAYRARVQLLYRSSSTAGTFIMRLRKGTSATPNTLPDWGRYGAAPIFTVSNADGNFNGVRYLVNNNSFDVTTDVTLTGIGSASTAVIADTNSRAFFEVELAGPAAKYQNIGMQIT